MNPVHLSDDWSEGDPDEWLLPPPYLPVFEGDVFHVPEIINPVEHSDYGSASDVTGYLAGAADSSDPLEAMAAPGQVPATAAGIMSVLPKLDNSDSDFRFMGLSDIHAALTKGHPGMLAQEYGISGELIEGILKTLDDQNGEVQNLAVKW